MDGAVAAYPYDGIAMTVLFQIEVEIIEDSGSRQADSLVGSLGGQGDIHFREIGTCSRRQFNDGLHRLIKSRLHINLAEPQRMKLRGRAN